MKEQNLVAFRFDGRILPNAIKKGLPAFVSHVITPRYYAMDSPGYGCKKCGGAISTNDGEDVEGLNLCRTLS